MSKAKQIFSYSFLILLLTGMLTGMIYIYTQKPVSKIAEIQPENGKLLTGNEYLKQVKLFEKSRYENKEPYEIKQILESHPYIAQADVELTPKNVLRVVIHEKTILAVVRAGLEVKFLTEDNTLLPLLENLQFADFPVVSSAKSEMLVNKSVQLHDEQFGIISHILMPVSADASAGKLSEIIFSSQTEMLLLYSGVAGYIRTSGKEIEKNLPVIHALLTSGDLDNLLKKSAYIDLRFGNRVYIATHEREENTI